MGRRQVVEFYVRYECEKKGLSLPAFDAWDWTRADSIDRELERGTFKHGVITGYLKWDLVDLSLDDVRSCAVVGSIFPGRPQALSLLEESGCLATWTPDRETVWHESICQGHSPDSSAALILRPAVSSESPAQWYAEDGSGRALALLANARRFHAGQVGAAAYRGRVADPESSFMKQRFRELLQRGVASGPTTRCT